jgi:cytochrome c oxidase subunit 2
MTPSMLDPAGPSAEAVADLWWIMFGISAVIYLIVVALVLRTTLRREGPGAALVEQEAANADERDAPLGERLPARARLLIVGGGVVLPAIVLLVLMVLSASVGEELSLGTDEALEVEVVGHRWWWEVRYPVEGREPVVTANEIHIPVGRPVTFRLSAVGVIHSFWVPQLGGKRDLIPGRVNTLTLEADEPGVYWGECAEFCGIQHAKMRFVVVAQDAEEFEDYLAALAQPADPPTTAMEQRGLEVFQEAQCLACHTLRGVGEAADFGPDLTHLARRLTIGAGTLENNRGNLGGWIVNSQALKPGNNMPPIDLSGPELRALLAYLESLQ